MKKQPRHLGRFAGVYPRSAEIPYRLSVLASEDVILRAFALDALREQSFDGQLGGNKSQDSNRSELVRG
jgi:hypothetical protein